MRIEKVTFSVARTIPLYPLTHDRADEYANIKPFASVTVEFEEDEAKFKEKLTPQIKALLEVAFEQARDAALDQLVEFRRDMLELYGAKNNKG